MQSIKILCLSIFIIQVTSHEQSHSLSDNFTSNIIDNVVGEKIMMNLEIIAPMISAPFFSAYFYNEILSFIKKRPYASSLAIYLLLNYACDTIKKHHELQKFLDIIYLLKKITLYIVVSMGIKNSLHQKSNPLKAFIEEQYFLNKITEHIPYSFKELTLITLKSYQELKYYTCSMNPHIHIESEEFIFLCHSSSIKIDNLLYLTQQNEDLHKLIILFKQNPQQELPCITLHLQQEISRLFNNLEKLLLSFNSNTYNSLQKIS